MKRRGARVGIGIVLIFFALLNLVSWRKAALADGGETLGYFGFDAAMLMAGMYFLIPKKQG